MGSVGVHVTLGLSLFLSQQLFIGVAQSQPMVGPMAQRQRWNPLYYYDPLPQSSTKKNTPRKDLTPDRKHKPNFAQLTRKPADEFSGISFPEDAAILDDKTYSLNKETSNNLPEILNPEEPQGVDYYENVYPPVFKRPLDTVGSHFMKKDWNMDMIKRGLDHVGIGLMKKRPLDHLGQGLLKKDDNEGNKPSPGLKDDLEIVQDRATAVELIKKGLDVLGTGLIKREDVEYNPGLGVVEMKAGLDQLSTGLGTGDPSKEVDLDMVKRGLDRLGSGLLKRGLDTVGIGLIKRGVDNIDDALTGKASLKYIDAEGLGVLQKGIDHLATVMEKDELNVDGFSMISKGSLDLASWVIQQEEGKPKHGDGMVIDGKTPESFKESDKDVQFESSKKSLDRLGSGLMKKRVVRKEVYDLDKDLYDKQVSKKSLDRLGSGLMKKRVASKESPDLDKDIYDKQLSKKSLDRLGSGLMKKRVASKESPDLDKDIYDKQLSKKSLDRLGSGLMKKRVASKESPDLDKDIYDKQVSKKSLDRLGSGLMKKRFNKEKSDSDKEFYGKGSETVDGIDDDIGIGLLAKDWELTGDEASLMNKLESLNYKLKKGFISKKKYLENEPASDKKRFISKTKYYENKPAFDKEKENNMKMSKLESEPIFDQEKENNQKLSIDTKPETEEKGYDVYVPKRRQGIDEDSGPIIMKKDLDYVGSGLIKKDEEENEPDWKDVDDNKDWMLKENLDWMDVKLSPEKQDPRLGRDDAEHKSQKFPQTKNNEKSKFSFKA